ncbi:MAG: (d)CMP kinase [Candidatus Staskawiczbacteria bacterium]|nr:(d)CMP kinase [Candidatus Staskawiczbacteria bacterium]
MIIAISGPSASGKGTLARMLAEHLSLPHYDFGLMFRAIAFLSPHFNFDHLLKFAEYGWMRVENWGGIWFKYNKGPVSLFRELKTEEVALRAANIARENLSAITAISKAMVRHKDFVCDGRTCGSEIYPDADYKFYITANEAERFGRRLGDNLTERKRREELDKYRLVIPEGAIVVDTTCKTEEESLRELLSFLK